MEHTILIISIAVFLGVLLFTFLFFRWLSKSKEKDDRKIIKEMLIAYEMHLSGFEYLDAEKYVNDFLEHQKGINQ